jgi:hypothetical protein
VHDVCFVRFGKTGTRLRDDAECKIDRERAETAQELLNVFAREVLEHEIRKSGFAILTGVEDLGDVLRLDGTRRARFALETLEEKRLAISLGARANHLDRDAAPGRVVFPLLDGTHPALSNKANDVVFAVDDVVDVEHACFQCGSRVV